MRWTPKTGQGPKVENRCHKEKTWDSGNSTQPASRRRSPWKRSKANEPSRNWHPATAFIRIKSQIGKSSWLQKLQRFSPVVAFTTTTLWSKKRRSSISRSESCRWNWTGFKKSRGSCDAERETGMHRTREPKIEHRAAVPIDRAAALDLVFRASERNGGESAPDSAFGRAIHTNAVLRKPAHGDCAGKSKAGM